MKGKTFYFLVLIFPLFFLGTAFSEEIDLIRAAPTAKWFNDRGLPLPFSGRPNDPRGFVRLLETRLEDGQSYPNVLETHPRWQANGEIEGRFTLTIPDRAVFEARVGFIQGAAGSDGVIFEVYWKEGISEVILASLTKTYSGNLSELRFPIDLYGGHSGEMILRVKAAASPAQDWAVWQSIKILTVAAGPITPSVPAVRPFPATPERERPSGKAQEKASAGKSSVRLSEVPREYQTLATAFITKVKGAVPAWKDARLGETVSLLWRPDIAGVAYYEFGVIPQGFIIISSGDHDVPVPHWGFQGRRMSQRLRSAANSAKKTAAKLFKLDDVTYVAEDESGGLSALLGTLPLKSIGINADFVGSESCPVNEIVAVAAPASGSKESPAMKMSLRFDEGLQGWASWQELKANYAVHYRPMNDYLRALARKSWQAERSRLSTDSNSRGIVHNHPSSLAQEISGPWFDLAGGSESIWSKDAPDQGDAQLSWAAPPSARMKAEEIAKEDQRKYWQFQVDCPEQVQDAASGCGPTAWAILFGWIDHQAAKGDHPYWPSNYRGVYRQQGGKGRDADAPEFMDDSAEGTGVKNMTKELRKYLKTYCSTDQGATLPKNMANAVKYLEGRLEAPLVIYTKWTTPGSPREEFANRAANRIIYEKTPVILGKGYHYPVAYGYFGVPGNDWFYLNNGDGDEDYGFVSSHCWFVGLAFPSYGAFSLNDGFAAGDVDLDGKAEIITAGDVSGKVNVFRFPPEKVRVFNPNFTANDALAVGDINGDGFAEILTAGDKYGKVKIYSGKGDFIRAIGLNFTKNDGFAVGDVEYGDKKAEILIAGDKHGWVKVYNQFGQRRKDLGLGFTKNDGFAVGDIFGEGLAQILIAHDKNGTVEAFGFSLERTLVFNPGFTTNDGFAVGDVNGDGKAEILLAGDQHGRVRIFDGQGAFIRSFDANFTVNDGFAVADVNGDGKAEILIAGDFYGVIDIFDEYGNKIGII